MTAPTSNRQAHTTPAVAPAPPAASASTTAPVPLPAAAPSSTPAPQPPRRRSALLGRNFLLLVAGQGCSLFGGTMLRFAMSMWVLDATGSATAFASLLALSVIPTILLSPFGGILADRINRRTLMVGLDACSGVLVLAAMAWFATRAGVAGFFGIATAHEPAGDPNGGFSFAGVGALMVALAVLGAFETPIVQAALPQILRGESETTLRRGMAVINQIQQLSSLLPYFIGGVLYGLVGIGPMMAITTACFLGTAALECLIRLDAPRRTAGAEADATTAGGTCETSDARAIPSPVEDMRLALRFLTRKRPNILRLMVLSVALNFFMVGYSAVGFPVIIRSTLGFDATVYGACEGVVGVASLAGAMLAGLAAARLDLGRLPAVLTFIGVTLVPAGAAFLLPLSPWARLAVLVASCCATTCVCGFANIIAIPAIQMRTPEAMTGKVMALVASFATCAQPLGQMLYGWLFDVAAPAWILLGTAAAILALSVVTAPTLGRFDR